MTEPQPPLDLSRIENKFRDYPGETLAKAARRAHVFERLTLLIWIGLPLAAIWSRWHLELALTWLVSILALMPAFIAGHLIEKELRRRASANKALSAPITRAEELDTLPIGSIVVDDSAATCIRARKSVPGMPSDWVRITAGVRGGEHHHAPSLPVDVERVGWTGWRPTQVEPSTSSLRPEAEVKAEARREVLEWISSGYQTIGGLTTIDQVLSCLSDPDNPPFGVADGGEGRV